jgi:hypothetical protein
MKKKVIPIFLASILIITGLSIVSAEGIENIANDGNEISVTSGQNVITPPYNNFKKIIIGEEKNGGILIRIKIYISDNEVIVQGNSRIDVVFGGWLEGIYSAELDVYYQDVDPNQVELFGGWSAQALIARYQSYPAEPFEYFDEGDTFDYGHNAAPTPDDIHESIEHSITFGCYEVIALFNIDFVVFDKDGHETNHVIWSSEKHNIISTGLCVKNEIISKKEGPITTPSQDDTEWRFNCKITGTITNLDGDRFSDPVLGFPLFEDTKTSVWVFDFWDEPTSEGSFDIKPMFSPTVHLDAADFDEMCMFFFQARDGSGFKLTPSGDYYTLSVDGYVMLLGFGTFSP